MPHQRLVNVQPHLATRRILIKNSPLDITNYQVIINHQQSNLSRVERTKMLKNYTTIFLKICTKMSLIHRLTRWCKQISVHRCQFVVPTISTREIGNRTYRCYSTWCEDVNHIIYISKNIAFTINYMCYSVVIWSRVTFIVVILHTINWICVLIESKWKVYLLYF